MLVDAVAPPASDPAAVLFALVAEALILQDEAEAVLAAVARHEHLGLVAPRGGPLVHRFFRLRDDLPDAYPDVRAAELSAQVGTILLHHAMQVATALEFLAVEGRSARLAQHVSAITGLGRPAEVLDGIYAELRAAR